VNFFVAGNQWHTGDSGLGDDHSIIRISDARESRGLEKQGCVVDAQINVIGFVQRNNEFPEWQGDVNFSGL
jgi:hypothetical protein